MDEIVEKNEIIFEDETDVTETEFDGDESSEYNPDNNYGPKSIYPADINITYKPYSVEQLLLKKKKNGLIMDPDFQRTSVWISKQKKELIESILMGMQLPSFYFSQTENGELIVVDGKQRLNALFDFLDNKFSLDGLKILENTKGKFKDLDGLSQAKIQEYTVGVNVIEPNTPARIMYDIFDRINRGGTPLTNQEVRNAIYQGKSTRLLKELADSNEFKSATNNSIAPKRMKDKYIILRFLTFYLWKTQQIKDKDGVFIDYKSDMNDFLGKSMDFINSCDDALINDLSNIFYKTMNNILRLNYEDIFRLPPNPPEDNNGRVIKRPINMPLFETVCYLLSDDIPDDKLNMVIEGYKKLIADETFINAVTVQVDNIQQIRTRFNKIDIIKKEIFEC